MQDSANVSLSAFERQLVTDAEWILTKNRIIQKVYVLFGNLSEQYRRHGPLQQLPTDVLQASPKIAKGENYEGLPYVMLDFPRCFGRDDTFAIRTFFWWGHFFSITLQLKGTYLQRFQKNITEKLKQGTYNNAWINVGEEEWLHHFRDNNMQPVSEHNSDLAEKKLVKIAFQHSFAEWEDAENLLEQSFQQLVQLLQEV
jgi:hypothetical protein